MKTTRSCLRLDRNTTRTSCRSLIRTNWNLVRLSCSTTETWQSSVLCKTKLTHYSTLWRLRRRHLKATQMLVDLNNKSLKSRKLLNYHSRTQKSTKTWVLNLLKVWSCMDHQERERHSLRKLLRMKPARHSCVLSVRSSFKSMQVKGLSSFVNCSESLMNTHLRLFSLMKSMQSARKDTTRTVEVRKKFKEQCWSCWINWTVSIAELMWRWSWQRIRSKH